MRRVTTTTKHPGMSDAEICRAENWGPGTRLVGDEGHGPTVIEITGVGKNAILAIALDQERPHEHVWTLRYRDWAVAT